MISNDRLVTAANWMYIYGHWPVIVATLTWLFVRHPPEFYLLRNALFISGAIGLLIFVLFPVAPPRLGILEIVDTVTQRSSSYRTLQPPGLVNRYAAVPSLHFGWNLLVGIIIWRVARAPWMRALAVLMVVAMGFAVLATANHYVLDVVAGAAVALTGLAGALLLPRVRRTPDWAATPSEPPSGGAHRPPGRERPGHASPAAATADVAEADVHLFRGRLEVRHAKTLGRCRSSGSAGTCSAATRDGRCWRTSWRRPPPSTSA